MAALSTHTFAPGDIPTAAMLNAYLGGNFAEIDRRTTAVGNGGTTATTVLSGSYTSSGTSVTASIGTGAVVILNALITPGTTTTYVGFAMSGATTQAASDGAALTINSGGTTGFQSSMSGVFFAPASSAGSTTFDVQWRYIGSGTSTIDQWSIFVLPLIA